MALTMVRAPRSTRGPIAVPVVLAVAGLWVGLFWYIRNLVQVGNPFGEIAVGDELRE